MTGLWIILLHKMEDRKYKILINAATDRMIPV